MGNSGLETPFAPGKANKGLACRPVLDGSREKEVSEYIYPGKISENRPLVGCLVEGLATIFVPSAIRRKA
jgi:hypothetical protein